MRSNVEETASEAETDDDPYQRLLPREPLEDERAAGLHAILLPAAADHGVHGLLRDVANHEDLCAGARRTTKRADEQPAGS